MPTVLALTCLALMTPLHRMMPQLLAVEALDVSPQLRLPPPQTAKQAAEPLIVKRVGKPAPFFSMKTSDGRVLTNKNLKGKVVLMHFWASWCEPAQRSVPLIQKMHKKYFAKGLVAIGLNTEESGREKIAALKKSRLLSYTFSYDNQKLCKDWHIAELPVIVILDRNGIIRFAHLGYIETMDANIDKLIEKLITDKQK